MQTDLDRLIYCLKAGFPAPITAAFLAIDDRRRSLIEAFELWQSLEWDDKDGDHGFFDAIDSVWGEGCSLCDVCKTIAWDDQTTTIGDQTVCDDSCLGNYSCCDSCDEYTSAELTRVQGGNLVCSGCLEQDFSFCNRCEEYASDYASTVGDGDTICQSCIENYYSWCERCDEYYPDNSHDHECGCESPHPHFSFPANGAGTIAGNERLIVELPKGTIDGEGLAAITDLLCSSATGFDAEEVIGEVGPLWQAKRGNFTRRLSRSLYERGIKLAPGVLSHVGNLAREHSTDGAVWHIELTRNLNEPPEAFYHEGSCWWSSHSESRCCLKSWGGLGLRTYNDVDSERDQPNGRAWVQPLDEDLTPTHDSLDAFAYLVYNGYGQLREYVGARIVAHLASRTYRKINFTADGQFVNGESAILVADEATCEATSEIHFSYDSHNLLDAHSFNTEAVAS